MRRRRNRLRPSMWRISHPRHRPVLYVDDIDRAIALMRRRTRRDVAFTTAALSSPAVVVAVVGMLLSIPPVALVLFVFGTGQLTRAFAYRR